MNSDVPPSGGPHKATGIIGSTGTSDSRHRNSPGSGQAGGEMTDWVWDCPHCGRKDITALLYDCLGCGCNRALDVKTRPRMTAPENRKPGEERERGLTGEGE